MALEISKFLQTIPGEYNPHRKCGLLALVFLLWFYLLNVAV